MSSITAVEIRQQLDRIVGSIEFAGGANSREKPRLAALLKYLIAEYLAGRAPEEHAVGIDVFGRRKDWITQDDRIVSATLRNLRDSLEIYYGTEGLNDPVHIGFPKGSGCRPAISYTRRSPADIAYRKGVHNLRSHAAQDLQNAIVHFQAAIGADPKHAAAHARMADALWQLSWYLFDRPPLELLAAAEQSAARAMELEPDDWLSLATSGVIHMCFYRWREAKRAFESALARDEMATRDYRWFYHFLDVTGDFELALEKSASEHDLYPDDVYRAETHVVSLYFARRFDQAEELCRETLTLDRYSFRAHGAMYLISVAEEKFEQALNHATEIHRLAQVDIFSGFIALCHAKLGNTDLAREILDGMKDRARTTYVTKFQLSAAYMGLDELDSAVAMLEGACEDYDPWMIYLHLMPFFDPLRNSSRFDALLQRIGLPYRHSIETGR